MKLLDGKVALITGATRGIGWAIARRFAEHGATVLVNGVADADRVRSKAAELSNEFGTPAHAFPYDVGDLKQVEQAFSTIFKTFKRLDVLVNNAGIMRGGMLGMISDVLVQDVLRVNTAAAIHHTQQAARLMTRAQAGSIVHMTSILGVRGGPGQSVYSSSKAAVIGLVQAAAKELAPKNIRVNAIAPGMIETDLIAQLTPENRAATLAGIGMGHPGRPEDVANAALYFASELSSYVTGQVLGVDGGMVI